jgi:hypothetical protein
MFTLGFGTTFSWNNNIIAGLTAINGIELKVDTIDVTTHQSANFYKEVLPSLIDAGEVSLEGNFDYTDANGQVAMLTDLNARVSRSAIITFPASTGSTWTFIGYITALKIGDAPIDDKIPFSATIKPTGKPVFATSASAGMSAVELSNSAVLAPTFNINTFDYVATVLTGISSITITPTASAGIITVNGNVVVSGQASSAIALGSAGSVTIIAVVVAETNKAPKTYTFRIVRT